jgi:hypothetical protein
VDDAVKQLAAVPHELIHRLFSGIEQLTLSALDFNSSLERHCFSDGLARLRVMCQQCSALLALPDEAEAMAMSTWLLSILVRSMLFSALCLLMVQSGFCFRFRL